MTTPTEPGWYWYRLHPDDAPVGCCSELGRPAWVVVYVDAQGMMDLPGSEYGMYASELLGEWGPRIPEPGAGTYS